MNISNEYIIGFWSWDTNLFNPRLNITIKKIKDGLLEINQKMNVELGPFDQNDIQEYYDDNIGDYKIPKEKFDDFDHYVEHEGNLYLFSSELEEIHESLMWYVKPFQINSNTLDMEIDKWLLDNFHHGDRHDEEYLREIEYKWLKSSNIELKGIDSFLNNKEIIQEIRRFQN